jgi:excisionase family DNA binding protein
MNHEPGRLKPWNSMREVAAHLSLSLRSLERRIKDGRLQAKKDGRLVRIKREWVLAYEMAGLL